MPSACLSSTIIFATTCLKWDPDGELCAEDRLVLLHRLMHFDSYLSHCLWQ